MHFLAKFSSICFTIAEADTEMEQLHTKIMSFVCSLWNMFDLEEKASCDISTSCCVASMEDLNDVPSMAGQVTLKSLLGRVSHSHSDGGGT